MGKDKFNTIVCPYCGTENSKEAGWCSSCGGILKTKEMYPLPSGTVLKKGKYTVLKETGKNKSAILYLGIASGAVSKILIRELYPASLVERELFSSEIAVVGPAAATAYETAKDQFRQEGKKLQTLSDIPNIATVRDVFDENGTVYIVEDMVNGETLQSYLSRTNKLSLSQTMKFVTPLMEALNSAHKRMLVHGNINLSDIVIKDRIPVLINFGISNIDIQLRSKNRTDREETLAGSEENVSRSPLGTYEAVCLQGSVADDIYGVAFVLYNMLTGKSPGIITNSEQEKSARAFLEKESRIDANKASAIMMGLSRKPSGRFKSMEAFLKALQNSPKKKKLSIWVIVIIFMCVYWVIAMLYNNYDKSSSSSKPSDTVTPEESASNTAVEEKESSIAESGAKADNIETGVAEQSEERTEGPNEEVQEETITESTEDNQVSTEPAINYMGEFIGVSGDFSVEGSPTVDPFVLGNTNYYREDIQAITFLDSLESKPANAWDISANKDGTVYAWVDSTKKLFIGANGIISLPSDCSGLFGFYTNVKLISFGNNVDTSNVVNMRFMFKQDENLAQLSLHNFDTSNVVSMDRMFTQCHKITKLDLSNFDTSRTKNMTAMFAHCYSLMDVNVSSFDTSLVEKMSYLFYHCDVIKQIDIRSFDTSRVASGRCMFYMCPELEILKFDTEKFQTSSMTDMHSMFSTCPKLKYVDVSHFDTSHVTDMAYMFYLDSSLTNLAFDKFDLSQVKEIKDMLTGTRWE